MCHVSFGLQPFATSRPLCPPPLSSCPPYRFAGEFRKLNLPLHVLVNNAGIHLMPYGFASHGFERTMAADFFGHAYLTDLLLDKLQTSAPSR